jgi:hypothetical protein
MWGAAQSDLFRCAMPSDLSSQVGRFRVSRTVGITVKADVSTTQRSSIGRAPVHDHSRYGSAGPSATHCETMKTNGLTNFLHLAKSADHRESDAPSRLVPRRQGQGSSVRITTLGTGDIPGGTWCGKHS